MDQVKKNGAPQVLNAQGQPVAKSTTFNGIFTWSNPNADILITGPNEEFLQKIHSAFKVDACCCRYGTQIFRTYKQFIIFYIADRASMVQLDNWIEYLRTRQHPAKPELFNVI